MRFPFVFCIVLALLGAFVVFSLYLIAGLRSGDYVFLGGAPFSPFMERHAGDAAVLAARWLFFIATEGLVLSTSVTILLELLRWRLSGNHRTASTSAVHTQRVVVRFDTHQVVIHYLIMSSVIVVGALGIPQAFPDWGPARWWLDKVYGGVEAARVFHHRFGYVVDAAMFYYVAYTGYSLLRRRKSIGPMLPRWKDLWDFLRTYLYCFGIVKEEPKYERYSYGQKIDFWVIVVCLPLLTTTGLVMYHTAVTSQFIPSTIIAVASVAHRHIALLLVWYITIVHFYYGHLEPRVFPVNSVILTGRMPEERYREFYPLDYERITRQGKDDPKPAGHVETKVGE